MTPLVPNNASSVRRAADLASILVEIEFNESGAFMQINKTNKENTGDFRLG